jgi:hypothetical protein
MCDEKFITLPLFLIYIVIYYVVYYIEYNTCCGYVMVMGGGVKGGRYL